MDKSDICMMAGTTLVMAALIMYTEQPIDEYNESLDTGTELKAHKRLRRIMRITQEIEQEENKEDEHII